MPVHHALSRKLLPGAGGTTTESYTYNGAGLLTGVSSRASSSLLTWDTNEKVPELIGVGKSFYITGPAGLPLEEITASGAVLFYEHDALGSTRALTNTKGQVVARYSYSPYGEMTTASCMAQAPRIFGRKQLFSQSPILDKGSCPSNPFLYAGQFLDKASGLYYMRARWYDPKTAQFTSVDPLVALTDQPYSYAGNDPISASDPTGLCLTCTQVAALITGAFLALGILTSFVGIVLGSLAPEVTVVVGYQITTDEMFFSGAEGLSQGMTAGGLIEAGLSGGLGAAAIAACNI